MMETDKREEQHEVKLGLELSDTEDYDVNSAAADISGIETETAEEQGGRRPGISGRAAAIFFAGFLCCVLLAFLCTNVLGLGGFVTKKKYDYYKDLDNSYGKYYEIMKMIDEDPLAENEVGEISDDELKEIVAATGDPYAEYFTAEEYEEFQKRYSGGYVGIGIGVLQDGDDIVIKSVFEDGPAFEAGIKTEDRIIKVDGAEVTDVDDAIDRISGEPGTKLTVTVKRGDEEIDIELTREKIDQDSVAYSPLEDDPTVGYIVITGFKEDTADEFKLAVRDLKDDGCDKFIIDLRDNGGGLTEESIEIADYLLPACRIMSEKTKNGKETVYNSKASSADLDCVVLVNGNTASASEILTAALQDNDACTVIGSKTYGKGVTQLSRKFRDGSAVKLTVTEYFRPNGDTVNGVGITPDVEAEEDAAFDEALKELKQ